MSRRRAVAGRRAKSVSAVAAAAVVSTLALPIVIPLLVVADLVRLRPRLPLARLGLFGVWWAWMEVVGVGLAAGLWAAGRAGDTAANYRLQAWWVDRLIGALRLLCGVRFDIEDDHLLAPGPTVLLARHTSMADALLVNWAVTRAGLRPRVVMKQELLVDPCLDVVGNRLPNAFVDRRAPDSGPGLAAIGAMADGLSEGDVAVIFPEGTRANPEKRANALERIAAADPDRAARMGELVHLLPPRPAGTTALLGAAPHAEVVVAWHTGLEGLDSFRGMLDALGRRAVVIRLRFRSVPEASVPTDPDGIGAWLDDTWTELDDAVGDLLASGDANSATAGKSATNP